ncbi:unnamed protein product [Ectocarpus sp. 12 AP-2014]
MMMSLRRPYQVFLAVVYCCCWCSEAKLWRGSARLSASKPWMALTSFAFDIGTGRIDVTFPQGSLGGVPEGTKMIAILDEDWPEFLAEERCMVRDRLNRWLVPMEPEATRDGDAVFGTTIRQSVRPHNWYLVVSHCNARGSPPKRARIEMSASFTQQGGSHISYEDKLTTKVIPLMLMAFTAAAAIIGNLFVKRRREGGGMHPTLQFMLAALGMHWVFLLVHTLHLRSFATNGTGYVLLDVGGEVLHWGGQLLVSYVLVGLAYGWTLSSRAVQKYVPDDKNIVYLLAGCLGFLHLMFVILGRMSDDHHAKSHSLDSAPAYFLVLVRLALLGVFLLGALKTFEAEQNSVRRGFIGRLVVLGSLWFAAMPVLVLVAMICAEYVQEPVVAVGSLLAQSLGLSVLSWLFLTRNEYYKMSSLAHTGMLPTNNFRMD